MAGAAPQTPSKMKIKYQPKAIYTYASIECQDGLVWKSPVSPKRLNLYDSVTSMAPNPMNAGGIAQKMQRESPEGAPNGAYIYLRGRLGPGPQCVFAPRFCLRPDVPDQPRRSL